MRDFNFFEPFLKNNDKKSSPVLLWGIAGLVCVLLMGSYHMILSNKYDNLQSDLETIMMFNNNVTVIKKINTINEKQVFLSELDTTIQNTKNRTSALEMSPIYDDMFLEKINAQVPEGMFIMKAEFSINALTLTGYAKNFETISQFVYNVKALDGLEKTNLTTVKDEMGQLQFNLELPVVIGGANNENF